MKKMKSAKRTSAIARKRAPTTVDEYIAGVPEPARAALAKMRAAIRSVVPTETAEIISYRIPGFSYNGVLVWYAAFSDDCSLFPRSSVIEKLQKELKTYSTSKGTIQFPLDRPLPIALIKKMVKTRVAQHRNQNKNKAPR